MRVKSRWPVRKESSLWPNGRSDVMPTNNTMLSGTSFGLPFVNYVLFKDTAYWHQLSGLKSLFNWYRTNPILFATIMIKARESANMRIVVRNRENDKIEPEGTRKDIPRRIYQLFNQPNAIQSRWEFFKQRKIFNQVAGNSFTYANAPVGMRPNIKNVQALWNVWPQYMQFILAGNYFEATKVEEIISKWRFEYGQYKKEFEPWEILHNNEPNIDVRDGLIFGTPIASSLVKPLSNIDMAYESRNIIMRNRGMRVILSSNRQDNTGPIPLLDDEKKAIEEKIKEYGTLDGQKQFFFSEQPLNATPIDQDVRKLGLFEEIATDAMLVANGFGVPEILLKLYLAGATFENQEASVRRLYQGTLIPEAEDDMISLNNFLGLNETDWMIEASFEHIPALQQSSRDKASANAQISTYMRTLFLSGACTHNQWLTELGMPGYGPEGDKRIWEYDDRQLAIIMGQMPKLEAEAEEQQQGNEQQTEEQQGASEEEESEDAKRIRRLFNASFFN